MRVGFDVSPLGSPHPRGIVRVVAGLVEALERRRVLEVVRLAPEPGTGRARWRQAELPRLETRLGLVGVHTLVSAFPLRGRGRRVTTIHELPWLFGEPENAGWRHRLWAHLGPRRADRVITATEHVARDVRLYSGVGPERIRVVPWGLDRAFLQHATRASGAGGQRPAEHDAGPARRETRAVAHAAAAFPPRTYVVCAGGGRAKKRPDAALFGAVELARRGGPRLSVVVTGPVEPRVAAIGGLACTGEIADDALAALYSRAAAVLVLARSEGFGLPVLEAQASGAAVVVARGTAQAEVAGTHGIQADPDDPASVADALERALALDDGARAEARARAVTFTWDRAAAAVEAVWAEFAR